MNEQAIDRAKTYLLTRVIEPALAHPSLESKIKARVSNSKRWIERFAKVGDLLAYLQRFKGEQSRDTFEALQTHGLLTFEEVLPGFEKAFSVWASDRSTPESFVIGDLYDSFRILTFVGVYDTRAGGMFLLGDPTDPEAVVVKATLNGGMYENAWIQQGEVLRYFLKSRGGIFGLHFQENAAIIRRPSIPVLCFVRKSADERFRYEGIFGSHGVNEEPGGARWFRLIRVASPKQIVAATDIGFDQQKLAEEVRLANQLGANELAKKLLESPAIPARQVLTTIGFKRSPYVISAVLRRAQGQCELCARPAPFARRDGSPYLEVHHRIRLADGGHDTVDNAIAACPNCHRQAHFGAD